MMDPAKYSPMLSLREPVSCLNGLWVLPSSTYDELVRVRAARANSKLTQTTVLDTQPVGYPNSSLSPTETSKEQGNVALNITDKHY